MAHSEAEPTSDPVTGDGAPLDLADYGFAKGTTTLATPCLLVDEAALDHNISAMIEVNPGDRLRPHVKAFKSTSLARRLRDAGHHGFTCATLAEVEGMIAAGLGHDLLLANETVDVDHLRRVSDLAANVDDANVTVAVDSPETLAAAVAGGVENVVIDVFVGLPRCGCLPDEAAGLATEAIAQGLTVRGVMGYEGHLMMVNGRDQRRANVAEAMAELAAAAEAVQAVGGGGIISAGGTGTYDMHAVATEIQAGSYTLMDTQYLTLDSPFKQALWVEATIISISTKGWMVADAGLKSVSMDHGNPTWPFGDVWFCSDEHITLAPHSEHGITWQVGDRVRLAAAHVDPTVAKHQRMWLVADGAGEVKGHTGDMTEWPVDLRHW